MRVALPGFFDLQVNGFAGLDFNAARSVDRLGEALNELRGTGVTRCLPTLITSDFDAFAAAARVIALVRDPIVAGIHMEGPYISPEDGARGAHPRVSIVRADVDDFRRRQEAADARIVLVTLAPEVDGALPLIDYLVASGVRVAIGHTMAVGEQIADAIRAGASLATHLGNGCPGMLARHPNPIWELLADDRVRASFIVDGHHLPPATVKAMIRAKGPARAILVSDAIAAARSPPGAYRIGGEVCMLSADGRVSLPGTPYLAGSSLTLDRAISNTVRFAGVSLDEAAAMASSIPAALLGMQPAGTVDADWEPATCELHVRRIRD